MTIEFKAWPKIPRLFRECVITEKLDGTNAAVGIRWFYFERDGQPVDPSEVPSDRVLAWVDHPEVPTGAFAVYAQSRKRIITPEADNYGFATWVRDNAEALVVALGEGLHFGEWWGSGVTKRNYGFTKGEKFFSLFNVERYKDVDFRELPNVGLVPVLYRGMFSTFIVDQVVEDLRKNGSQAAPGFMNPEGVITFHSAANMVFKTTLTDDEKPKGSNELG